MQPTSPDPVFLNLEYVFMLVYRAILRVISFLFSVEFLAWVRIILIVIIILLVTWIIYCLIRTYEWKQEDAKNEHKAQEEMSPIPVSNPQGKPSQEAMWKHIRERLISDIPSDWRLAIIEADIYMDRLLDAHGYYGDTLGDKLKGLTPQRLASLSYAWEAHKVRNKIAHQGSDYVLTQPEARRVLSYYEIVFRELGAIQ